MTAIPHAALALTSALGRFEHASSRVLEAATGADDLGRALAELSQAKVEVKAGATVLRLADDMYRTLLDVMRR